MKQHFQIPWAQILIVCAALVMAFGMGGSVQVEQEAVGQREAFRRSLQMLDQYLCALSEDLGDPDILALEAPLEDDRIQENLVRVRRTSVALKQDYVSNAGRETSPPATAGSFGQLGQLAGRGRGKLRVVIHQPNVDVYKRQASHCVVFDRIPAMNTPGSFSR